MIFIERMTTRPASATRALLYSLILLISPLAMALSDSQLNGIGTYNHMGKDYYLVAHYTSQSCESTPQCEQATTPAQFSLKITTPRWTAHSYSLVWQRELASNNNGTLDKTNMEALLAFTRIAETQLTRGDTIDLAYDGSDTTIAVNKVFAVRAPGKTLFNYIGRVWLGPVPPSREFKHGMLAGHSGEHDSTTVDNFNALQPSLARMSLLDTWHTKKNAPQPTVKKARKPVSATVKNNPQPTPAISPAALQSDDNIALPDDKDKDKDKVEHAPVARAQQLAALEWHIHNTLFQQVKYPSWARQFDQEGSVSVTFTLNSQLSLVQIDSVEPLHAGLLGEAVVNALQRSQPFSFPPGINIDIETLTSTYQHDFSLSKAATPPPKPSGISDATISQLLIGENHENLENLAPEDIDTDVLRAHLNQYVDYPYWAKSLRLKGTVKALITLNAQGLLEDITIMEGSRNAGFNQAITNAAQKAAPYPVTPQSPDNGALISFDYQYHFTP